MRQNSCLLITALVVLSACAQPISPDFAARQTSGDLLDKIQRHQAAIARDPDHDRYAQNLEVFEAEAEKRFSPIMGMTREQLLAHWPDWKPSRTEKTVTNDGTIEQLSYTQERTRGFWPFRKHTSIPVMLVTLKDGVVTSYRTLSPAPTSLLSPSGGLTGVQHNCDALSPMRSPLCN